MRFLPALALISAVISGCSTTSRQQRAEESVALAQHLKDARKLEEAAKAYADALDLDPTNLVALRGYVETRQKLGRLREAEARFSAALADDANDPYAHEGLGLTWYAMGAAKGADAAKALQTAVRLAPDVADFHYRYGVLLVESDRWVEANEQLAEAVKKEPSKARYRLPYALALARTGQRGAAVRELAEVLKLQPTRDEVVQAEKTARVLVDPFRGFPQAAREQFEMALNWLEHDSLTQAQQVLDSLLEKYPDLAIVHATSGLCAAKMDDAGRAVVELRRAAELDPDLAEPRFFLGDLYAARGRPQEAREHYEAALARNPFLADAWRRLAETELKSGDRDAAAAKYATYLLLRPDDFDALVAEASLLSELGKPEAGAAWDDAAKTYPRRPEVLVGRARWYFVRAAQSGDPLERKEAYERCEQSLEKALEVDGENQTAAGMLAELHRLPK